jgi:ketosteroid isomerase-like protein
VSASIATLKALVEAFNDHDPDVHYDEDSHYVDGDMGISQWTVSGTMKSGERIRARGCDFYTFRGDKVVKKDSFWKIVEKP